MFCFSAEGFGLFWLPGSVLSCFLLFCHSAFLLASPLFCFSAFLCSSLLFAFPSSLPFMLVCLCTFLLLFFYAIMRFCFSASSYSSLLCFLSLLSLCFYVSFLLFSPVLLALFRCSAFINSIFGSGCFCMW